MTSMFLNEDAYYRVLKAFAAGSYDLVSSMSPEPFGHLVLFIHLYTIIQHKEEKELSGKMLAHIQVPCLECHRRRRCCLQNCARSS